MSRVLRLSLPGLWLVYAVGMVLLVVFVQIAKIWPANPLFPFTSFVFFLFTLNHALLYLGLRRGVTLFAVTFCISLAFESLNLISGGWVFGPLSYTHKLGLKLFGLVPLLIPLTWFTMGYLSLRIAERLVGDSPQSVLARVRLAMIAAVVMTCWDLGMDPIMVAKNHWLWHIPGMYFGIPLHNFAGWLVTSFCFYLAWLWPSPARANTPPTADGRRLYRLLAPSAYAIMCVSMTIANANMGQFGPAVIGFLATGAFALYWLHDSWRSGSALTVGAQKPHNAPGMR